MGLKTLRQIFRACADDTRLRILSLLDGRELTVKEMCFILKARQPTISKHLTQLRLLRIVIDKREGNLVYYRLNLNPDLPQGKVLAFIVSQFHETKAFKRDKEVMRSVKKHKPPHHS